MGNHVHSWQPKIAPPNFKKGEAKKSPEVPLALKDWYVQKDFAGQARDRALTLARA